MICESFQPIYVIRFIKGLHPLFVLITMALLDTVGPWLLTGTSHAARLNGYIMKKTISHTY